MANSTWLHTSLPSHPSLGSSSDLHSSTQNSIHPQISFSTFSQIQQKQTYSNGSSLRPSSHGLDFPRFNGSNLRKWLNDCEDFFYMSNTPLESRVELASDHLEGKARQWYDNYMRTRYGMTPFWSEFVVDISSKFAEFDPYRRAAKHNYCAKSEHSAFQVSCVYKNDHFATRESAEIVVDKVFEEMPQRTKCPQHEMFGDILENTGAAKPNEVPRVLGDAKFDVVDESDDLIIDKVFDDIPIRNEISEFEAFDEIYNYAAIVLPNQGGPALESDLTVVNGDLNVVFDVTFAEMEEVKEDEDHTTGRKVTHVVAHDMFDEMPARQISLLGQYDDDLSYYVTLEGDEGIDLVSSVFDVGGVSLFIIHGKVERLKSSDDDLLYAVCSQDVGYMIAGHVSICLDVLVTSFEYRETPWMIMNLAAPPSFALDSRGYPIDAYTEDVVFLYDPGGQLKFGVAKPWSRSIVKGTLPTPRDSHGCIANVDSMSVFGNEDHEFVELNNSPLPALYLLINIILMSDLGVVLATERKKVLPQASSVVWIFDPGGHGTTPAHTRAWVLIPWSLLHSIVTSWSYSVAISWSCLLIESLELIGYILVCFVRSLRTRIS